VARRRGKRRDARAGGDGPEPIGDLVKKIVKGSARRGARTREEAEAKWVEVVGPEIAARTSVTGYDRRVLRIGVESSALLAELAGFYKEGLLESLQSGERPLPVVDVRFELGGES